MKTVVYTCPFVPAEWIAAHGLRPSRIVPSPPAGAAEEVPSVGFCPYARALVRHLCGEPGAEAAVFTTVCDQMRRGAEIVQRRSSLPVFLMHVPTTWQTSAARGLYLSELRRLGRFLVDLGGVAPSEARLTDTIRRFDAARGALRKALGLVSARRFAELAAEFHRVGEPRFTPPTPQPMPLGVPVAVVGGPLLFQHFDFFDMVERAGGRVALDATACGERALPAPVDRRRLARDPLGAVVEAYFDNIPDAFRRPNSALYEWLRGKCAERGVRGILFLHYVWCDTWHAEAQRVKESSDVPALRIEATDSPAADGPTASAIQSLLEAIR